MLSVGTLLKFINNLGHLTSSLELALLDSAKAQDSTYKNKLS
ncbi:MAG: hypothetical protein ACI88A_001367 [Paraglaciecola sp.]|jgi:hypothetical protein